MRRWNKCAFYLGFLPLFQVFIMPLIIPQWLGNNKLFCIVNLIIFLTFLYIANRAGEKLNNPSVEDLRDEKIDRILK